MMKPTILIVDDNPANRHFIKELLKPFDFTLAEASDGHEAVSLFAERDLSLILMDIEMSGMDGIEATKQIRLSESGQKRTPIVAVSAHSGKDKKLQALCAGMDDYLIKRPWNKILYLNI